MKLYDQHLHSRHSFDSRAEPDANVERAIERGLSGLTFTEHFDTHPDEWPACVYDDEAYSKTIRALRAKYGDSIFIGKGIEVCYQPSRMSFILEFLDRHEFDVVLLSVHYFGSDPVHVRNKWAGLSAEEGTRRYLETVLEAVRFCETLHRRNGRRFDVLSHLDFVKRYTQRFFGTCNVEAFGELLNEILQTCIRADLIPEINTSTLRQGLSDPMPSEDTIGRYANLGGTAMSLGSDAHRPEDIGADLDQAVAMLKRAGLGFTPVFKNRERQMLPVA